MVVLIFTEIIKNVLMTIFQKTEMKITYVMTCAHNFDQLNLHTTYFISYSTRIIISCILYVAYESFLT